MDSVDSTCFCEGNEEEEKAVSSSSSRSTWGQPTCCCCHYDPFADDDSPETKIKDLSFALKKLAVMKCQMKKWRIERLELESQNRSLKQTLQIYGVEPNAVLKSDPVLVHLRTENVRLQSRKEELEDEVRDIREILADRECYEDNPCDAVAYLKEKMLAVRHRCAVEKRHMRETIANLQIKLQEAQDDGSCAALNRLRAKLRELMNQCGDVRTGGKADQVASIALEKSIETMAEFSKNCDELKRDNERLLREVEALKCEIKEDVMTRENFVSEASLEEGSVEMTDLLKRVKACESTVTHMRLQLAEKDNVISDLQTKLFAEKQHFCQLKSELEQMKNTRADNEIGNLVGKRKTENTRDDLEKALNDLKKANEAGEVLRKELEKAQVDIAECKNESSCLRDESEKLKCQVDRFEKEQGADTVGELNCLNATNAALLAEVAQLKNDIGDLCTENKQLKCDNEKARADASKAKRVSTELSKKRNQISGNAARLAKELEALKAENEQLKKAAVDRSEGKEKNDNKVVAEQQNGQIEKEPIKISTEKEAGGRDNDFVQASKALKLEMEMQIEAIQRVREFMNYAEGKACEKPSKRTDLFTSENHKKVWSASEINELFKISRQLSEAIVKTEEEVQQFEDMLKKDESILDCLPTSNVVQKYNNNRIRNNQQPNCCRCFSDQKSDHPNAAKDLLNRRIVALQCRIVEKQREAATRTNEMHRALLVEQARLIKISDDVSREQELNLTLRQSVDPSMMASKMPMDSSNDSNCCYSCG